MSRARRAVRLVLAAAAASCGGEREPAPAGGAAPPAADPLAGFDCTFEDTSAASGIDFVHETGGTGAKLLPETMGSGAALLDWNSDGALDLFLVNSGALAGGEAGKDARCALYRGRGDATFEDVSRDAGADIELYGMGCAAADFDADGDQDVYVTALGENKLLVNHAGQRFSEHARAVGIEGGRWTDRDGVEHPYWSTAAVWLDAEIDGDLDLFVGGYCRWTPELEIFTSLDGVRKAFTTPDRYEGLPSIVYLNLGAGFFVPSVEDEAGTIPGRALGAAAFDLDQDGRDELVVAHDTRPNALLWNRGGGRFEDVAERAGVAYDPNGRARAGMGIDLADLEADGRPFLAIGNFVGEPLSFYRFDGQGFEDWSRRSGLSGPSPFVTFGLAFLDADLDGLCDLVLANGHIEPEIELFRPGQSHAQPAQLFRGLSGGRFADASAAAGAGFAAPRVGRGLAAGDLDGDGDQDLVLTQNGGRPAVLVNRAQETRPRHFLRVVLRGSGGNRDALGAVITLEAGGRVQRRTVRTGSSYLSQGELSATFGLGGGATAVERLSVRWPGGETVAYPVPGLDRTLELSAP